VAREAFDGKGDHENTVGGGDAHALMAPIRAGTLIDV
jgi:hypothetical protein